ncbi:MAG: arginine--tRNA ligase [Chloroflexota bacterium]|nr:MAG: arginine--tRNA ligase [Chloroflexota bacterium]
MFKSEQEAIELKIREYLARQDIPNPEEIQWNPIPFSGEWGISTPCFPLAAGEARAGKKVNVPERAQEIAAGIVDYIGLPEGFRHVEAVKGYLNLYFSSREFSQRVVDNVLREGEAFGRHAPSEMQVMLEYSNPNTHKAFHVGHLRSAILGESLARITEFAGHDVVRANYIGDMGLHVIKWLWNYQRYHLGEKPPADTTRWMGDLYSEANQRLEQNPELEAEVRELYSRWDRRDPEVVALWEETRQWSVDHFEKIYAILGIHFDRWYSNSQMEQPGKQVVEQLIADQIAEDERSSGGPVIVRIDDKLGLEKETYRVLVVLRSDGTALYATEDLALAISKFSDYDLSSSIYIVDVRQSLHFQQVFKTLEIANYAWAARNKHIPYEVVNLPGNVVMASRDGTIVLLDELISEARGRALEIVEEKNPALEAAQKEDIAKAVGLGAIKYSMLARDNAKIVTFDWDSALDFNGQAAPYIQYAHVRANSILRRLDESLPASADLNHELDATEIELIDAISRFPGEVQRAAAEYKPLHITNLAYDLARLFNDFYQKCPVLKAEPEIRAFRLRLVAASRQTIANALYLLSIQAPEVM